MDIVLKMDEIMLVNVLHLFLVSIVKIHHVIRTHAKILELVRLLRTRINALALQSSLVKIAKPHASARMEELAIELEPASADLVMLEIFAKTLHAKISIAMEEHATLTATMIQFVLVCLATKV
jgi:hypothetical protein